MQLLDEFNQIFIKKKLKLKLTPYEILPVGPDACLVEMIQNAISFDGLKKKLTKSLNRKVSLFEYFGLYYNDEKKLKKARKNFCYSLAAYSLYCYFLQLKDRHNGNIMLHQDGRIIHIDFGFLFTKSPGGAIEKKVPFKLTSEYVAVLGDKVQSFVKQFTKGFNAIVENKERILQLFSMLTATRTKPIESLEEALKAYNGLKSRLEPPTDSKERKKFIHS